MELLRETKSAWTNFASQFLEQRRHNRFALTPSRRARFPDDHFFAKWLGLGEAGHGFCAATVALDNRESDLAAGIHFARVPTVSGLLARGICHPLLLGQPRSSLG